MTPKTSLNSNPHNLDIHNSISNLMPWYANNTLDRTEKKQVTQHLISCSQCRNDLKTQIKIQKKLISIKHLSQLSFEHQTVVILTYIYDYSYTEISEAMCCPISTVKSQLFIMRKKLRDLYLKYDAPTNVETA